MRKSMHERIAIRRATIDPASGESSSMLKAFHSASPDVVGRLDLSHAARRVVPSQTQPVVFPGTVKDLFLFAAVVSWTFTFMFIHILPRLEERLGVGDR
jgi:hypothetical protein